MRLQPLGRGALMPIDLRPREGVSVVFGMTSRQKLSLAALIEFHQRVGSRRVEQPAVGDLVLDSGADERLGDQVRDRVEDLKVGGITAVEHRGSGFPGENACEYRQAPQRCALEFRKQIIAPIERHAQRLVARLGSATARHEQSKAIVQESRQSARPEGVQ